MRNTVLITGAGSGIGRAAAQRFARDGFDVLLVGRGRAALEASLNLLEGSGSHEVMSLDVADRSVFRQALDTAMDAVPGRRLVGVFANAGIGGPNAYAEDAEQDRWDDIMRANVTGGYVTLHVAQPHLLRAPEGRRHAVVTSSVLARFGVPGQSAYVTSKTAVLGLVRSLAVEWGGDGILVNAVCPGWVETDMARNSIQGMAEAQGMSYAECHAQQCALLPTGRMSEPAEVADFVAWLMSEEQKGITGQGLDLNNGSWMS